MDLKTIHRRRFFAATAATAAAAFTTRRASAAASATSTIDDTIRNGIGKFRIPAAVAMVATSRKILYSGAFGQRDSSGALVTKDSIFQIMSMTKAVTTVAALQMVEKGKVKLDEPVSKHLPQFASIQVLDGFDAEGKPNLRPAAKAPTLRHLITHTSGLCYDIWDPDMFRLTSKTPEKPDVPGPLIFEPGTRWQYGRGIDWAGRLVETLSGLTLEEYFQQHICKPLGMADTSYLVPDSKFDRLVTNHSKSPDGAVRFAERTRPAVPKSFNGGGGLFSTVTDYTRFMQMILNHGIGANKARILTTRSIDALKVNQIGTLTAGKMKTMRANLSADVDIQPGHDEKWTLAFLLNTDAYKGGRSAGSLAWAGLNNTFFWIDPKRDLCAVLMMQFLPFVHPDAVAMLNAFERAVYRS